MESEVADVKEVRNKAASVEVTCTGNGSEWTTGSAGGNVSFAS